MYSCEELYKNSFIKENKDNFSLDEILKIISEFPSLEIYDISSRFSYIDRDNHRYYYIGKSVFIKYNIIHHDIMVKFDDYYDILENKYNLSDSNIINIFRDILGKLFGIEISYLSYDRYGFLDKYLNEDSYVKNAISYINNLYKYSEFIHDEN